MRNQQGFAPVLLLIVLTALIFIVFFVPIPERVARFCMFSEPQCQPTGWRFGETLWQQLKARKGIGQSSKQMCGGIAGILCPSGYVCRYEGDYPDAAGVCVK